MTIRHRFDAPYWYIEQSTTRYVRQHNSSLFSTPDQVVRDWEIRGIYDNFYTSIIECLQLMVEEEEQIESIDLGFINPASPLITNLRSGLTSLTL